MKIKRTLFAALTAAAIMLCGATAVFAAEEAEPTVAVTESVAESDAAAPESGDVAEENAFAAVYGVIEENADKILAALSFAVTIILAWAYKCGLLPALRKAMGGISDAAKSVSREAEKSIAEGERRLEDFKSGMGDLVSLLEAVEVRLGELEGKLSEIETHTADSEAVKRVLGCEVDMLSELFLSSSIPDYQKETVGMRVAAMRKELGGYEKSEGK